MPRMNGTRLLLALFLVLSASSAPQASQRWMEKRAENPETTQAGSVAPQRKAMTLWEARKAILETLPRVMNHREWEVAWGSYDDEDVTISAARVSAYTIEYDYTSVRYTRRYSCPNGNSLCSGRDSGTDKLDLKKIGGVVGVVSPGWIPAGGRKRRYTKSSCLGYCLTAGGEYVDSYLVWSGYQEAKAVADALNRLSAYVRGERTPEEEAAWRDFPQKAAAWRTLAVKPPLPDEARKHRILAEQAFGEKDLIGAVEEYEGGLAIDPVWPDGHFNAALLYAELGLYYQAIQHMRAYVELVPDARDTQSARDQMVIWEAELAKTK
jgi:tetratricopeptide (TPR) repeat protein